MKGRDKCELLNEVRQKIAEKNDIEFTVYDCTFEGDCTGTCPKCESEIRYLEEELAKKQARGEKIDLEGIFTLEESESTCIEGPEPAMKGEVIDISPGIIIDDPVEELYRRLENLRHEIVELEKTLVNTKEEQAPEGVDPIKFEEEKKDRINQLKEEIEVCHREIEQIENELHNEPVLGDMPIIKER